MTNDNGWAEAARLKKVPRLVDAILELAKPQADGGIGLDLGVVATMPDKAWLVVDRIAQPDKKRPTAPSPETKRLVLEALARGIS